METTISRMFKLLISIKQVQIYTKKGNDILFLHHKVSGGLYLNKDNAQLGPEMAQTCTSGA